MIASQVDPRRRNEGYYFLNEFERTEKHGFCSIGKGLAEFVADISFGGDGESLCGKGGTEGVTQELFQ